MTKERKELKDEYVRKIFLISLISSYIIGYHFDSWAIFFFCLCIFATISISVQYLAKVIVDASIQKIQ